MKAQHVETCSDDAEPWPESTVWRLSPDKTLLSSRISKEGKEFNSKDKTVACWMWLSVVVKALVWDFLILLDPFEAIWFRTVKEQQTGAIPQRLKVILNTELLWMCGPYRIFQQYTADKWPKVMVVKAGTGACSGEYTIKNSHMWK